MNIGLCRPGGSQIENQRKRKERQVLRPCKRTKTVMEHGGDGDTDCIWCTWNDPQLLGNEAGRVGNRWTSRDYPIHCIAKNVQDTEKSPGNLRRLVITQTPLKDNQLTLVWRNPKGQFPLVRYLGPLLKETKKELQQIDQRTRKCITMHKMT